MGLRSGGLLSLILATCSCATARSGLPVCAPKTDPRVEESPLDGPGDAVPDEEAAIHRARPAFEAVYGKQMMAEEEPLVATAEVNGTWSVRGTMHCGEEGTGFGCMGGTATATIVRRTGRFITVCHGK